MSSEENLEDFKARLDKAIGADETVYRITEEPFCTGNASCVYQGSHEQKQCPADKGHEDACAFGTMFSCIAKQPCDCKKNCPHVTQNKGLEK